MYILAAVLSVPVLEHAWQLYNANRNEAAASVRLAAKSNASITGTPSRIVVPTATIDLPVVTGSENMRTHIWSVDGTRANYADITAQPNTRSGQTLIYGHNNHKVFARLLGLKKDAVAYVYTGNNHIFEYRLIGTKDLSPDRTDLFQELKQGTGLVLMTCDGPHFEYRHAMFFRLMKAA